jgi:NADPH:quinone reductase-like Zn-dependent oxidoreductase
VARFWSGLFKPKYKIPGGDIAGIIEQVGEKVTQLKKDDHVYGDIGSFGFGAYAEYVSVPEKAVTYKPNNLSFWEAAAVPQYSVVALQGLRDAGQIKQGQKVLVNGASGGIGTFAVQIAKAFGAEVTGVCSTKNLELVSSLGADHIIDYTHEDFVKSENKYDLILDIVANRSISEYTSVLNPSGSYVAVAFNASSLLLGTIISMTSGKKVKSLVHKPNIDDLNVMRELIESGKVVPVIDRRYKLEEVPQAFKDFADSHPSGKAVIIIDDVESV